MRGVPEQGDWIGVKDGEIGAVWDKVSVTQETVRKVNKRENLYENESICILKEREG